MNKIPEREYSEHILIKYFENRRTAFAKLRAQLVDGTSAYDKKHCLKADYILSRAEKDAIMFPEEYFEGTTYKRKIR